MPLSGSLALHSRVKTHLLSVGSFLKDFQCALIFYTCFSLNSLSLFQIFWLSFPRKVWPLYCHCSWEDTLSKSRKTHFPNLNNKPWRHCDIIIFFKNSFSAWKRWISYIYKVVTDFFYQILSLLMWDNEFSTSLWHHFSHNVVCFPATFPLLASTHLFFLFWFIQNKNKQNFITSTLWHI